MRNDWNVVNVFAMRIIGVAIVNAPNMKGDFMIKPIAFRIPNLPFVPIGLLF